MFNSIIGDVISPISFLACISTSLILGVLIAIVHSKTVERANKNFAISLAVLPTLVAVIIMLVNGNVGTAVATVGAFSLVRFRSIPGNSRSIMAIFFAMAIGLAIGTGYIVFAAFVAIIVSAVIFALAKINFCDNTEVCQKLTIVVPEDLDYTEVFDALFDEFLSDYELVRSKTINMGSLFELKYSVKLKNDVNEKKFIDKIRARNGNLKVSLSHKISEPEEL